MIYLVEANESHLPLMMAWRSNPLVYSGFYQQHNPLVWEEHLNWWKSRNQDWRVFVIMYEHRPVGIVTIGQLDYWNPEVGYYLGETTLWGKGIGTEAVRLALEWISGYAKAHNHITGIHTTIKDDNLASIRLIKKLGFKKGMKAREGETYWVRKL